MTASSSPSLRAFQQRLSDRLQAAQAGAGLVPATWLALRTHGRDCLLPLRQCGAWHPWRVPEPVPHGPAWLQGVVALPGGLYAVADLGGVLGPSPCASPTPPPTAPSSAEGLLTLPSGWGLPLAWRVERCLGLRGPADFTGNRPPAPTAACWWQGSRCDAQGRWWSVLDLAVLVQSPSFRAVDATLPVRG